MKTLNDYFQEVHCINLDRRTDRWEECQIEFKKHNLKVERYSAFDGNNLTLLPGLNAGQTGAVYSHRGIVEYAKQKSLNNILILEDDVEFDDDINLRFSEIIDRVPDDWDMLLFGGNHSGNNPWSPGKLEKVSENIFKVTHSLALHCYAVKNTIYDRYVESLNKTGKTNDALVADIQQHINCYIFRPHLAWQRPSHSDLREMYVDMPFLYNDSELYEGRYFGPEMLKRDDIREKLTDREKIIYDKEKKSTWGV
jgi:GR25 family glycosyltransferase involved in LPS biosynthesis